MKSSQITGFNSWYKKNKLNEQSSQSNTEVMVVYATNGDDFPTF